MAPTARTPRAGAVGATLLVLGLACAGGYRLAAAGESAAYAGHAAPTAVTVRQGGSYLLAVPGGVAALQRAGVDPGRLQCQWSAPDTGEQLLDVSALGSSTRATDAIASFTAGYSGPIRVSCLGWGAVYVAGADGAPTDYAGVLLVLATIALTAGAPLALSGLRAASRRPPRQHEEVERLVDVVRAGAGDDEVAGGDRRDVAP
ncbi:MAG: hypothetical protein EPN43_09355 [Jatrophihabitans sp.]|nr:MAG: hypothetical protein EPN43_09355 [Jatrophihabitans sp.]